MNKRIDDLKEKLNNANKEEMKLIFSHRVENVASEIETCKEKVSKEEEYQKQETDLTSKASKFLYTILYLF